MPLSRVQAQREKLAADLSKMLLLVSCIELYCWLWATLADSNINMSDFAPAFFGIALLLLIHNPIAIVAMVFVACVTSKKYVEPTRAKDGRRIVLLLVGPIFSLCVIPPIFIVAFFLIHEYWPMIVALGMTSVSLLVSNILYLCQK